MNQFFENIRDLDKTCQNVSVMVIKGPHTGQKALWHPGGYIFKTSEIPLWNTLERQLKDIKNPKRIPLGEDEVFCESLGGTPNLIICGAGHVSMPIITLGRMLGFQVTCIDDRPQFANNARNALAHNVICDNFMDALKTIPDDKNNYFVIVTRGHRYDIDCLEAILPKPSTYVGMIGSRLRIRKVKESLVEKGFESALIDTVHMPIGLNIKAETPEEIGVAIMAEIIESKNTRYATYHYSRELLKGILDTENTLPRALLTIITRKGSAPRNAGTKMLLFADGSFAGTIGGGCAEAAVINKALQCIRSKTYSIEHVDMTGQSVEDEGMVCGGVIDVFVDPLNIN